MREDLFFETRSPNKMNILVLCKNGKNPFGSMFCARTEHTKRFFGVAEKSLIAIRTLLFPGDIFKRQIINMTLFAIVGCGVRGEADNERNFCCFKFNSALNQ